MFQYALYWSLKQKFPQYTIKVDASCFRGYNVHNGLEIEKVFGVEIPQASFWELAKVTRPVYNYKLSAAIKKFFPARKTECFESTDYTFSNHVFEYGDRYYWGYWQNWKYFIDYAEEIRNLFRFQMPLNTATSQLLNQLTETKEDSVSIHIRRGDYLNAPNYAGLCGIEYYRNAINYIIAHTESPRFFVFSDDIDWCRKEIAPLLANFHVQYIDWNKGAASPLDMLLMSNCHHNIIANSSFSWWAAFLNMHNDKIVCAPRKWTNTKVNCTFQLPEWILF